MCSSDPMSFTASYDPALRILSVSVHGPVSPELLDATLAAITASTEYPANVDTIWDFRAADFSTLHADQMRRMLAVRKKHAGREGSFTAMVAEDDVAFGMSRMFQFLADGVVGQDWRVTRSLADAEQWILASRRPLNP